MKIRSLEKEKSFIPEFMGNRDLPESEQITVNIKRFPNNGEVAKVTSFKRDSSGKVELSYDEDYMLKNMIGSITGIELPSSFKTITNGSSLIMSEAIELRPLIVEIRDYLLKTSEVITEGES